MTTWYETSRYSIKIKPVEVTRFTDKCVWVKSEWCGRENISRRAITSDGDVFHPTWAEAHAHLLARCERHLENARNALQKAQSEHGNVKGMKQPPEAT